MIKVTSVKFLQFLQCLQKKKGGISITQPASAILIVLPFLFQILPGFNSKKYWRMPYGEK